MLLFNFSSNFFLLLILNHWCTRSAVLFCSVAEVCSVLFFFFWASIQIFFLVGPRFRGPNLAGLNGACGARQGRVRAGKKIRLVNFQIFPKIFPTLNFIYFLFFSLPLFPAQILLYIFLFFHHRDARERNQRLGCQVLIYPSSFILRVSNLSLSLYS